jgi:hypothetical protein
MPSLTAQIPLRAVTYRGRPLKAGADDKTVERFDSAAALPVASKKLMVDLSPDVLSAMGLDPGLLPTHGLFWRTGAVGGELWLCVDELKQIAEKKAEAKKADPPTPKTEPMAEIPKAAALTP